jgi:hypothetical protein
MVTKQQAMDAKFGAEFHYCGRHACTRTHGPRGGVTETVMRVRVSGRCRTWKRDAARYRLPVKYGLYESSAIEPNNAEQWHSAEDCPLLTEEE